jgi:hypothetical protein
MACPLRLARHVATTFPATTFGFWLIYLRQEHKEASRRDEEEEFSIMAASLLTPEQTALGKVGTLARPLHPIWGLQFLGG